MNTFYHVVFTISVIFGFVAPLSGGEGDVFPSVRRLGHVVATHDAEITMIKQSLENQAAAIETMHQEVQALVQAARESSAEPRVARQEKVLAKVIEDCKTLKSSINDTATTVSKLQQSLSSQNEVLAAQSKQIQELHAAVRALAKIIQPAVSPSSASNKDRYRVKAGDSLEKIAKENATTVQALKEINDLKNTTIHPGQELRLPQ